MTAIERHTSISSLAGEWDELADRLGASPFTRPGWIEAWMEAFCPVQPLILAARGPDGRLSGVLPLIRRRGALASPTNWHTPGFGALAHDADAAGALAGAILDGAGAYADLGHLDPADPFCALLRDEASRRGLRAIERSVARQPYVSLDSCDFEAYERALPRKQRKEAGRLRRRLDAEGAVSFDFPDGSCGLDELLSEGFAIEGSGWKSEQGSAILSRVDTYRFYTAIARWAAARGWLRLAFLRLDGRPIAFDMCIEAAGCVYVLKGGFDADYRRLGPGVVLTHESLRRAFADEGLRSYEFLGTDDDYKLAWTSTVHERVRMQVFSRSPLGRVQHVAWSRGRPLAKRALARVGRA